MLSAHRCFQTYVHWLKNMKNVRCAGLIKISEGTSTAILGKLSVRVFTGSDAFVEGSLWGDTLVHGGSPWKSSINGTKTIQKIDGYKKGSNEFDHMKDTIPRSSVSELMPNISSAPKFRLGNRGCKKRKHTPKFKRTHTVVTPHQRWLPGIIIFHTHLLLIIFDCTVFFYVCSQNFDKQSVNLIFINIFNYTLHMKLNSSNKMS